MATPSRGNTQEMLALPARLGGLGLLRNISELPHNRSVPHSLTESSITHQLDSCYLAQQSIKRKIQHTKCRKQKEDRKPPTQPTNPSSTLIQEKGASTWLTALLIDKHGFAQHEAAFRNSLSLRYGFPFRNSPSHCSCGQPFSVKHALTCQTGGFQPWDTRDITATLLTKVCHGVTTEPHLQPLSGKSLSHRSAITEDGAQLDVAVYGFWEGRFDSHQWWLKKDVTYAATLNWMRCRLSFALLRASIMSIRGARSSWHHPATECPINLQLAEGHLNAYIISIFLFIYFRHNVFILHCISPFGINYGILFPSLREKRSIIYGCVYLCCARTVACIYFLHA